jgi:hypothetical protein
MRPARALRLFRRKECGVSFPFSDAYLAALDAPGVTVRRAGPQAINKAKECLSKILD